MGISGLCTSELSFTCPAPLYAVRAAKVILRGVSGAASYYIDSREQHDGIVSVRCVDRMAFMDEAFPYDKLDNEDKNVPIASVMALIVQTVGNITGYGGIPSWLTHYPRIKCEGAACADILSDISDSCCGVWYINSEDNLQFLPFGSFSGQAVVDTHTPLDKGIEFTAAGIRGTDGKGNVYERGDVIRKYDSIIIDGELITDDGINEIWSRAAYTYKAVSCERCKLSEIPSVGCDMAFRVSAEGYETYRINDISCSISAVGIYATAVASAPSDSEIGLRGRLTRAAANSVKYNSLSGIQRFTAYQGVITEVEA